jgi:hypothetical protein
MSLTRVGTRLSDIRNWLSISQSDNQGASTHKDTKEAAIARELLEAVPSKGFRIVDFRIGRDKKTKKDIEISFVPGDEASLKKFQ